MIQQRSQEKKQVKRIHGIPLIGNALELRFNRLVLFTRVLHECGDLGLFYFGSIPVYMVNSPEYIYDIFVRQAEYIERVPIVNKQLIPLLGASLLTTDGDIHKIQRKKIKPAFTSDQIIQYSDTMSTYADNLWKGWDNGSTIDLNREMMAITLKVIALCLFGFNMSSYLDVLRDAFAFSSKYIADKTSSLHNMSIVSTFIPSKAFNRSISHIDMIIQQIIQTKKSSLDDNSILSNLLKQEDVDVYEISSHIKTLMFAGHETTANALCWTLYLLAKHPLICERLYSELDTVLEGRRATFNDIPKLPYVSQVLKESMRIYPPVHIIPRRTIHPIAVDGYEIPTNVAIGLSPYAIHRRNDYFPEPHKFNPDRFTIEREKELPRYAYIPFGVGPHTCIGSHFAMTEACIILATIMQHVQFKLLPDQKIEPEPAITLRPRFGIKVVVHRRQHTRRV